MALERRERPNGVQFLQDGLVIGSVIEKAGEFRAFLLIEGSEGGLYHELPGMPGETLEEKCEAFERMANPD